MEEIKKEIEKIKYQLSFIIDTIDFRKYPIASLLIELNWGHDELEAAHDIFEEADTKLMNKEQINWTEFELKLRNKFDIGYQTVKSIVLAFYRNNQWNNVCKGYAKEHPVMEFWEINNSATIKNSELGSYIGEDIIIELTKVYEEVKNDPLRIEWASGEVVGELLAVNYKNRYLEINYRNKVHKIEFDFIKSVRESEI